MPLSPKGFPVLLSFDLDAETMWTARDPKNVERPILMSQGAYGWKVGVPRILEVLDRYGLKVTFFIPGLVMEQRPAVIEQIMKGGHEIAHHSWSHAWIVNLTPAQEREEMEKGIDIIQRVTGRKPVGYRSPAAEFSAITLKLVQEYGFGYSSNYFDDDSPSSSRSRGCWTTRRSSSTRSRCRAARCRLRRRCSKPGAASSTCCTARTATSASRCTRRSSGAHRASRCSRS